MKVKDGKVLNIIAKTTVLQTNTSRSVTLNGQPYDKYYINFNDIINGGTLEFTMGDKPSETWGTTVECYTSKCEISKYNNYLYQKSESINFRFSFLYLCFLAK